MNVLDGIRDHGLVVVIRATSPDQALRIADQCIEGGARMIEITFTVPAAPNVIETLARRDPESELVIGGGTVLSSDSARRALDSGAQFIVSPALIPEAAQLCRDLKVPYIPGAGTVREILNALECGAEIVKVFPGEVLGPSFVRAVKSCLPDVQLIPSGGVAIDNIRAWLTAGCVAVGVGGNLTQASSITDTTKRFLEAIRAARA